jgi:hypothetical protein
MEKKKKVSTNNIKAIREMGSTLLSVERREEDTDGGPCSSMLTTASAWVVTCSDLKQWAGGHCPLTLAPNKHMRHVNRPSIE